MTTVNSNINVDADFNELPFQAVKYIQKINPDLSLKSRLF